MKAAKPKAQRHTQQFSVFNAQWGIVAIVVKVGVERGTFYTVTVTSIPLILAVRPKPEKNKAKMLNWSPDTKISIAFRMRTVARPAAGAKNRQHQSFSCSILFISHISVTTLLASRKTLFPEKGR